LIDPVIFTINLFGKQFPIYWYGVIIALAVVIGGYIAEREVARRGGNKDYIWDILIWIVPAGVIGARLGYVLNDIAGGSSYFLDDPMRIILTRDGGLHIYGAIALGLLVGIWYTKRNPFDMWMLLDAVAPVLLICQAFGRLANFINQELYGPPTDLPWGISIAAEYRIPPWNDLVQFPEATTRFHPTFAYEMIWNLLAAGLIIWLTRRFKDKMKPGAAFYTWMVLEGVGRFFIEYFRPDQPRFGDTDISFSRIAAVLLVVIGGLLLLIRFEKLRFPSLSPGPEKYWVKKQRKQPGRRRS
jgi:phosphatidylglycerol:prolipoprotein diacylglycerol transferase